MSYPNGAPATVLYSGEQTKISQVAMDVINELSLRDGNGQIVAPTSAALIQTDVQAQIIRRVEELVTPAQAELLRGLGNEPGPSIADIVKRTASLVAEHLDHLLDVFAVQRVPGLVHLLQLGEQRGGEVDRRLLA